MPTRRRNAEQQQCRNIGRDISTRPEGTLGKKVLSLERKTTLDTSSALRSDDDVLGAERVDLGGRIVELGENFVGVLAARWRVASDRGIHS